MPECKGHVHVATCRMIHVVGGVRLVPGVFSNMCHSMHWWADIEAQYGAAYIHVPVQLFGSITVCGTALYVHVCVEIFPGLSIVSEVLQEELGPAHSHTHFSHSYSTDSTAELLRPVPRSHLPLLHPPLPSHSHSSHSPPSLTITSLTCSTIAEQPSPAEPAAFEERTVSSGETSVLPRAGEGAPDRTEQPVGPKIGQAGSETVAHTTPPPSTPPLSQKRLLSSPLHHSTPRTLVSRSRVFPGRDTVRHTPSPPSLQSPSSPSFPFPKVTSSPPHPLPTSTETDSASSVSDGEHEGDSVTGAHTTVTVATQTQEEAASTAHLPHPATVSTSLLLCALYRILSNIAGVTSPYASGRDAICLCSRSAITECCHAGFGLRA